MYTIVFWDVEDSYFSSISLPELFPLLLLTSDPASILAQMFSTPREAAYLFFSFSILDSKIWC